MNKNIVVYYSGQGYNVDVELHPTGKAVIDSVLLALRTKDDVEKYQLRDIPNSRNVAPTDPIVWTKDKPFLMTKLPPAPAVG